MEKLIFLLEQENRKLKRSLADMIDIVQDQANMDDEPVRLLVGKALDALGENTDV